MQIRKKIWIKFKITGEVFYENISIEEGAVVEAQVGKRKNK